MYAYLFRWNSGTHTPLEHSPVSTKHVWSISGTHENALAALFRKHETRLEHSKKCQKGVWKEGVVAYGLSLCENGVNKGGWRRNREYVSLYHLRVSSATTRIEYHNVWRFLSLLSVTVTVAFSLMPPPCFKRLASLLSCWVLSLKHPSLLCLRVSSQGERIRLSDAFWVCSQVAGGI